MVDPAVHCMDGSGALGNVYPMINANHQRVSACLVKLTDTSLKQLKRASKNNQKLSLKLQQGSTQGSVSFSGGQSFSFALNDLSKELGRSCISALEFNADKDNDQTTGVFESLSKLTHRLQVQATEEAYDQARESAQKLQEEDQKKQGIPLNMKGSKATTSNGKVKQKAMQVSCKPSGPSVRPPSKPTSPQHPRATPLQNEISKKPLMQRLVHLLILKASTRAKILERIMNEGLSEADAGIFDSTLKEISLSMNKDKPDEIMLKPSLYASVDVDRWVGYGSWEKKVVRQKLTGGKSKPTTTPNSQATADGGKSSIVDRLIPFAPSRKRTHPMPQGQEPKTMLIDNDKKIGDNQVKRNGIENDSGPQPPSPDDAELTPPPQPNSPPAIHAIKVGTDWNSEFSEIRCEESRDNYQMTFSKEYKDYTRCYEQVKKVADEFRQLEDRLNRATESSPDYKKVERDIVAKYNFYNNDMTFIRVREKHEQLRAKLAVIKDRVRQWDNRPIPPRAVAPAINGNMEDLTVM